MYALLEEAYKVYQQEVLLEGKLHHRFAKDFASFHSYIEISSEAEISVKQHPLLPALPLLLPEAALAKSKILKVVLL